MALCEECGVPEDFSRWVNCKDDEMNDGASTVERQLDS